MEINYRTLIKNIPGAKQWQIKKLIPGLRDIEIFVIERRFAKPRYWLLREVAEVYPRQDGGIGVGPERVRQIEHKALRKLRNWVKVKLYNYEPPSR